MTDPTRRTVLQSAVAAGAAAALPGVAAAEPFLPKGHVKHSVVFWCFNAAGEKWDADTTCRHAKELHEDRFIVECIEIGKYAECFSRTKSFDHLSSS